jgi:hypothetical protein
MAGPCSRPTTKYGPPFGRNPGVPGKLCLLGWKPLGRGGFSRLLCRSSFEDARYSSLLTPCTRENPLPSLPSYQ